jgi:hypothetical protein
MFISVERYGWDWLTRPLVLVLFGLALVGLLRPIAQDWRSQGGLRGMLRGFGAPAWQVTQLFYALLACVLIAMLWEASGWNSSARIVPVIVGTAGLIFVFASAANAIFRKPVKEADLLDMAQSAVVEKIHMDLASTTSDLPVSTVLRRGAAFFGWIVAFMASTAIIGLIPSIPLFVVAYMRLENREPWKLVLPQAIVLVLFFYLVFDQTLNMAWPETLLGTWWPELKVIPSL